MPTCDRDRGVGYREANAQARLMYYANGYKCTSGSKCKVACGKICFHTMRAVSKGEEDSFLGLKPWLNGLAIDKQLQFS